MPGRTHSPGLLSSLLAAIAAATLLGGCGGGVRFAANAPAPGLELGVQMPSESMLSAEVAYSQDPIVARYVRYEGGSKRPARRRSEIRVTPGEGSWTIERYRLHTKPGREPRLERRVLLSNGGDGSVLLRESEGGDEELTTVFDPPMRLAGALMRAGETIDGSFRLSLRDASGEEDKPGEGSARVTYVGRQSVETPMGTYDADLIMSEMTLDFGLVKVVRQQRQWIATVRPGRTTLVAEDIIEKRTVLGWTSESRLRLAIEAIVR